MMPETVDTDDNSDYIGWVSAYTNRMAKQLHDQNCQYAKYLHDSMVVYGLYGALDGLSCSYSTDKYFFDMMVAISANTTAASSDIMHDWMMTPLGIATVVAESLLLMTVSVFANIIDDEEKDVYQRYRIEIRGDQPIDKKCLYLYLDNNIIHCVAKNKQNETDDFILQDELLGPYALDIKNIISSNTPSFSNDHLSTILEATTKRNDVQAKYNLYVGWRYSRDMIKGLKNAYKGMRATMIVTAALGLDLRNMLFPISLALGVLSGVNRIWYRSMKDHRKMIQSANKALAKDIRDMESLSKEDAQIYLDKIGSNPDYLRVAGMLSAAYGGIIDGLYLYMGSIALASFTPLGFTFIASCSVVFVGVCIATRVYAEYEYQRKLVSSELTAKLTISRKRVEALFAEVQSEVSFLNQDKQKLLYAELDEEIDKSAMLEKNRKSESTLSPIMAAFSGLQNGLAAGGAVGSLMFAIATVNAMLFLPCSPALVIGCVTAGMVLVIAGLTYSLIVNQTYLEARGQELSSSNELKDLLRSCKVNRVALEKLDLNAVKTIVWSKMDLDPAPQFWWQEWSEVARSFFSGLAKGQKAMDYTLNSLQETDDEGHNHDTVAMLGYAVGFIIIFAVTLALRAYARVFGGEQDTKIPVVQPVPDVVTPSNQSFNELAEPAYMPGQGLVFRGGMERRSPRRAFPENHIINRYASFQEAHPLNRPSLFNTSENHTSGLPKRRMSESDLVGKSFFAAPKRTISDSVLVGRNNESPLSF